MKGKKPTKNELDLLGSKLFRTVKKTADELENIVSTPGLYDGALSRISEKESRTSTATGRRVSRISLAASGAAVALSLPLIGSFILSGDQILTRSETPENKLPEAVEEAEVILPPDHGLAPPDTKVRPASQKRAVKASPAKRRKSESVDRPKPIEAQFYAIGITNGLEDAMIDGRVVRVDLPRSALYAMGIEVPLENGVRPIQADLLVGADGTPRAIRILD
ncbi:MAG TPA: hypothetical protein PKD26_12525 [Pyrinomonadaceae bacterium]|nr:hypothetical protein [Pyrinomonadaceae bacterium]